MHWMERIEQERRQARELAGMASALNGSAIGRWNGSRIELAAIELGERAVHEDE